MRFYNKSAPIQKKALLIGDSFSRITSPLLPLLINMCNRMDMRYYKGDFAAYYNEFVPDIIVVLVNKSGNRRISFPMRKRHKKLT